MKIKILDEKKNRLVFETEDATPTLCNLLQNELHNDSHVKIATCNVKHPLISHPKMIVETDAKDPRKALSGASDRIKKTCVKFEKEFSKEV